MVIDNARARHNRFKKRGYLHAAGAGKKLG